MPTAQTYATVRLVLLVVLSFFDRATEAIGIAPLEYLLIASIPIDLGYWLLATRHSFRCGPPINALAVLLMVSVMSTLLLAAQGVTWAAIRGWAGQFAFRIFLVAMVIVYLSSNSGGRQLVVRTFAMSNLVVASLALLLVLGTGDLNLFRYGIQRMTPAITSVVNLTQYYNPNALARFLLISLPFVVIHTYPTRPRQTGAAIVLNAVVVLSTESRMCMLLMGFQLLFYYRALTTTRRTRLLALTLAAIGGSVFASAVISRFNQKVLQVQAYSTSLRLELMRASVEAIAARPLLGYGPGTAERVVGAFTGVAAIVGEVFGKVTVPMHNTILLIGVETGVVGALAYVCLFLLLARRLWRRPQPSDERLLRRLVALSVLTFFGGGFTAVNIGENAGWIAVGLALTLTAPQRRA